jgi:hypothetical protein
MKRGQSTTELALLLPLIGLLIAGTLQVGVLISDQLALNNAAYEGGLWAVANGQTATADGGTAGTTAQHILAQLCGTQAGPPSTDGTRYCKRTAGIPDLTVSVSSRTSSLAARPKIPFVTDAYADGCNLWRLALSPATATIVAGSSQVFTTTLSITAGQSDDPTVTLSTSGYPPNLVNGNPTFNPPSVTQSPANTSRLTISTRVDTPPGTYRISISGQDGCGRGPDGGGGSVTLIVTAAASPSPSPSAGASPSPSPVSGPPTISSVSPASLCAATVSTIALTGTNFAAGATVAVGTTNATSVTVSSATQLSAVIPAMAAGTYNVAVTVSGNTATQVDAVSVLPVCAATPSPAATTACAAGSGRYQTVITINFYEPLVIGLTSATPYIKVTARHIVHCQ